MKFRRRLFLFIPFLFSLIAFHAPTGENIKISILNLRNNKGHVLVSLFNSSSGFPDRPENAVRKAQLAINNYSASVSFTGLPSGKYAVAILHDENDDLKMNTNFFGIPKEGYGFSNNVMGTFGPPSFSRAGFDFTAISDLQIAILARYGW
ncbi:MAG: DUF2141 domain-containing protein [Sphingobacteriales bacterium]|nr:DUF2141 domain-containing protein [Sphingobacteriales bacterium]